MRIGTDKHTGCDPEVKGSANESLSRCASLGSNPRLVSIRPQILSTRTIATSRTLPWLLSALGYRGQHLSRGPENPDRQRVLWRDRSAGRRREPSKAGPDP